MLPAETRLAPLQLHLLGETPPQYPFPIEHNPALGSIPKVDPGTIPITLKVNAASGSDNFYEVKIAPNKAAGVPQRGVITALEWSFSVETDGLVLRVQRATVLTSAASNEAILTPLERNPQVAAALLRYRYRCLLRHLRDSAAIIVSEDLSDNSALASAQLLQLAGGMPPIAVADSVEPSGVSQEGEGYNLGKRPLPEAMVVDPPADIGRGAKNRENAEDFSRVRKRPVPAIGTQDDLLSVYRPKRPAVAEEEKPPARPRNEAILEACREIGIEKFPDYALEFLKSYYKL